MSVYCYCMFMYLHRANCHPSATLTEVFPCFFLSCKANARVKLANMGHGPKSSKLVVLCVVLLLFVLFYVLFLFVLFYVLFVCKCVLYYCHRVLTQLQLTNISYISYCRQTHHTYHIADSCRLRCKWCTSVPTSLYF